MLTRECCLPSTRLSNQTLKRLLMYQTPNIKIASCRTLNPWLCGMLLLPLVIATAGCERAEVAVLPPREIGTVDLTVEFADGRAPIEVAIPCSDDSTAFSTLERAHRNGDLKLNASGTGERAFVHSIDGVAGDSQQETYWIFFVNDEMGERGSGVTPVDPGDRVRWSYLKPPASLQE